MLARAGRRSAGGDGGGGRGGGSRGIRARSCLDAAVLRLGLRVGVWMFRWKGEAVVDGPAFWGCSRLGGRLGLRSRLAGGRSLSRRGRDRIVGGGWVFLGLVRVYARDVSVVGDLGPQA